MAHDSALLQDLQLVFDDVFDDPVAIAPSTTARDVKGWDSLAHIRLIVAVERRFAVKFSASEVSALKNVGDLMALVSKKRK